IFSGFVSPNETLRECTLANISPALIILVKSFSFFSLVFDVAIRLIAVLRSSPSIYSIKTKRSLLFTCRIFGTLNPSQRRYSLMAHSFASLDRAETAKLRVPNDHNVSGNHLKPDQSLNLLTRIFFSTPLE